MKTRLDPTLLDMLVSLQDATEVVVRITRSHARADIHDDILLQLAVTKAVEWVGEMSGRVLKKWPDFAAEHPDLELTLAYRARNRLAHGYDTVDFDVLWTMATLSVPQMRDRLGAILGDTDTHARP